MLRRSFVAVALAFVVVLPCARAEDHSFISNGVKIHYIVEGKGEPVLLIHGFAANIQMQWATPGIINALAKHYQVIAFDNRGHGLSGKPHDPQQYGLEMVEDAIRLLDHLRIKKAHVVGYSMGAMITNKLETLHPERLRTATLGGAAAFVQGKEMPVFDQLADSLEQGKGFGVLIEALTPPGRTKPTEAEIATISQILTLSNDTKALAAVVRGWKQLGIPESKLRANKVPTLALIGDLDPLKKNVDEIAGVMSNVKEVVIENADHMTAFVNPEFVKTVEQFLAKHPIKKKQLEAVGAGS